MYKKFVTGASKVAGIATSLSAQTTTNPSTPLFFWVRERKVVQMSYETTVLDEVDVPIGGLWTYRVRLIEDGQGVKKIRVVKGKIRTDGSVSQVQKINFKTRKEAEEVFRVVLEMFDKYEEELS